MGMEEERMERRIEVESKRREEETNSVPAGKDWRTAGRAWRKTGRHRESPLSEREGAGKAHRSSIARPFAHLSRRVWKEQASTNRQQLKAGKEATWKGRKGRRGRGRRGRRGGNERKDRNKRTQSHSIRLEWKNTTRLRRKTISADSRMPFNYSCDDWQPGAGDSTSVRTP